MDRNYWKGHFVSELADELIDELLARIGAIDRPPGGILIESLRGGPKKVPTDSAAVGYRHAAFNVSVMASWTDPALDDEHIAWARDTAAAIGPGRSAADTPTTCRPTNPSTASAAPSGPNRSNASVP